MDPHLPFSNSPSTVSYMDLVKRTHIKSSSSSFESALVGRFPALRDVVSSGKLGDLFVSDIVLDQKKPVRLHVFGERTYKTIDGTTVEKDDIDHLMSFCSSTRSPNRFRIAGLPGYRVSLLPTLDGFNMTVRLARLDLKHQFPASFLRQLRLRKNVLIFGAPGSGKTTCLRSILHELDASQENVVAVDQSDELAVNCNTRVCFPDNGLADGILEVVRNHTPSCIVLDEIVNKAEVTAVMHANDRGVQIVASTHASSVDNICANPAFVNLNGGRREAAVGDHQADKSGRKFLVERRAPPCFQYAYDVRAKKMYDLTAAIDKHLGVTTSSSSDHCE